MDRPCLISTCKKPALGPQGTCKTHLGTAKSLGLIGPRIKCITSLCEKFQSSTKTGLCENCRTLGWRHRKAIADPNWYVTLKKKEATARALKYKSSESERLRQKIYREKRMLDPKVREMKSEYYKQYEKGRGAGIRRNQKRMRKQHIKKATPPWADIRRLQLVYKNVPVGHHVDHIIPLRGKNVCGLHVHYNLQYLPAEQNLKKGNKLEAA